MKRTVLPVLALTVLGLTGCSSDAAGGDEGAPEVAVAAYPFAWLVQQVGGEAVDVVDLTQGGVEPHDLELGPRQVARVQSADVVVTLKGFQPALDDAVEDGDALFDLASVVEQREASSDLGDEEGGLDPHVWLDPVRLADAATALGARLEDVAPGSEERAATTAAALREVDARYRDALVGCERRDLVTSHTAFAYLAERYDLRQVGVAGTTPEDEPSPGRLAEVVRFARSAGVTTVFSAPGETAVAETVAGEIGAEVASLSTLEAAPDSGDLVAGMDANLQALRTGLGCA